MKILLATDGSRYALAGVRTLAVWFERPGTRVDILSVVPRARKSLHRSYGASREIGSQWRGSARLWLDEAARPLEARGFRVGRLVRLGNPAEVVVTTSGKGYDLAVVGAKGRGDAPFFDVGSVALSVLEHAPASVLMVREREAGRREKRVPTLLRPLRVLLATDGSAMSDHALRRYLDLMKIEPVRVYVVAVADAAVGGLLSEPEARAAARRAAAVLRDHAVEAEPHVCRGSPVTSIIAEADRVEADLIVLGSRGVSRPEERHLGGVALEVARSTPCSVLVFRERVSEEVMEGEPIEVVEARTPFDIAYRNVEPTPVIEKHVLRGLARLERVSDRIVRCRVTVERRHGRKRRGNLYHVRVDLTVPEHEIVVSRTPAAHRQDEEVVTAIGEAFDTAVRRLGTTERRHRGEVKTREAPAHGRVTELMLDHGFIEGVDGRTIYFHRHSVVGASFDALEAGSEVRYVEEMGEEGPQASTVYRVGKHHSVG